MLLLLLGFAPACRPAAHQTAQPGQLELQWSGSDGGKLSAPATGEWCALRRLLEIRAVQGDTGVAIAVYPAETLTSGRYPIADPVKAESVPPAAGVALRWLTQNAVLGFQGDSGTLDLKRAKSGQLSGQIRARARSVVDTRRVTVTGTFRDLTIRPEARGCVRRMDDRKQDAQPGDTGVHSPHGEDLLPQRVRPQERDRRPAHRRLP